MTSDEAKQALKKGQIYYDTIFECLWLISGKSLDYSLFELDNGEYFTYIWPSEIDELVYVGDL